MDNLAEENTQNRQKVENSSNLMKVENIGKTTKVDNNCSAIKVEETSSLEKVEKLDLTDFSKYSLTLKNISLPDLKKLNLSFRYRDYNTF